MSRYSVSLQLFTCYLLLCPQSPYAAFIFFFYRLSDLGCEVTGLRSHIGRTETNGIQKQQYLFFSRNSPTPIKGSPLAVIILIGNSTDVGPYPSVTFMWKCHRTPNQFSVGVRKGTSKNCNIACSHSFPYFSELYLVQAPAEHHQWCFPSICSVYILKEVMVSNKTEMWGLQQNTVSAKSLLNCPNKTSNTLFHKSTYCSHITFDLIHALLLCFRRIV